MANTFKRSLRLFATLKHRGLSIQFVIVLVFVYFTYFTWNFLAPTSYIDYTTKSEEFKLLPAMQYNGGILVKYNLAVDNIQFVDTASSHQQNNGHIMAKTKSVRPNLEAGIKQEVNTNKNNTADIFYGVGCGINPYRKLLQKLLIFWNKLTRRIKIEYFICDGSLLGYQRNGEFVPYDHDIDICMKRKHFHRLLKLESKRPIKVKDKQPHLIIAKAFSNGMRLNCKGILVDKKMDPCSIISPAARVILGGANFIDVYLYTKGENYTKVPTLQFEASDIYPTKPCWLAGIRTRCPSKTETLLSRIYGKDSIRKPSHVCKERQFVAAGINGKQNELPFSIQRVNTIILKRFQRSKSIKV